MLSFPRATLEKTIDGFFHHRAQLTVVGFIEVGVGLLKLLPIAVQALVERGVLGSARAVDSRRYSHRLLQRPSLKKCEIMGEGALPIALILAHLGELALVFVNPFAAGRVDE